MAAPPALDRLPTCGPDGAVRVVVEASAGSRNKLKFEPSLGALELHHVLPLGTSFPYDFGFLPSTRGADGDPLDGVVFANEPVPPGTAVPCRLLGVIEAQQAGPGEPPRRNDRFLAVACKSEIYRDWHAIGDVPGRVLEQLERFFACHNEQRGTRWEVLARGDQARAAELLAAGRA